MIDHTAEKSLRDDGAVALRQLLGTPITELDGCKDLIDEGRTFADSDYVKQESAKALAGEKRAGLKDWLVKYPSRFDPLMAFATNRQITDTVAAVIGPCVLHKAEIWYVIPWRGRQKQWSQSWHRDPESKRLIKLFLYLRDVDEDCGPFEYVVESHRGDFDLCPPGVYLDPKRYGELPQDRCRRFPAPAGTLLMANTSGMHRGGYGTQPRVTAAITYLPVKVAA